MSPNTLFQKAAPSSRIIGFSMFSAPFFENASNGLLNYLFQDDTAPVDAPLYDPFQANYLNSDNYETDAFNDMSSVSTQRTGDIPPGQCISLFEWVLRSRHSSL